MLERSPLLSMLRKSSRGGSSVVRAWPQMSRSRFVASAAGIRPIQRLDAQYSPLKSPDSGSSGSGTLR